MKYINLILFFFGLIANILGQGKNNTWYFGSNSGLNFNNANINILNDGVNDLIGGTSSISDSLGNLLFYSDGQTVWNKNHVIMNNGNTIGISPNADQSVLILPYPKSDSLFHVFAIDELGRSGGLQHGCINITLDGGNGAVTSKNEQLLPRVSQKLTATYTNNGDIWLATHAFNSNEFYFFLIDKDSLHKTPIQQTIGLNHGNSIDSTSTRGEMTFSLLGEKLAVAIGGQMDSIEVFDFDKSTAQLSNLKRFSVPISGPEVEIRGVEFSPNSNFLYISVVSNQSPFEGQIYQYNLLANNIEASAQLLTTVLGEIGGLQLGNDSKIYFSTKGSNLLNRIENPNLIGIEATITDTININPGTSLLFLPNQIKCDIFTFKNPCLNANTIFDFISNQEIDSIHWNFGDGNDTTGFLNSISYAYADTGLYTIDIEVFYTNTLRFRQIQNIRIYNSLTLTFTPLDSICQLGSAFLLTQASPEGGFYEGTGVNSNTGIFNPLNSPIGTHILSYIYEDSLGCIDTIRQSIEVTPLPTIVFSSIATFNFCINTPPFLFDVARPEGGDYVGVGIDPITGFLDPMAAGVGTHTFTYTISEHGCTVTEQQAYNIHSLPDVRLGNDTAVCITDPPFIIDANIPGGTFSGTGIIDLNTGAFSPASAFTMNEIVYTFTDANNCINSDTLNIENFTVTNANLSPLPNICINTAPFKLTQGFPVGGQYSGLGINSTTSMLSPVGAGLGNHTLSYTYVNSGGCVSTTNLNYEVFDITSTILNNLPDICINAPSFILFQGDPIGGLYSGNSVSMGRFYPDLAGIGLDTIYYAFTNAAGCIDSTMNTINVLALSQIVVDAPPAFCINTDPFVLDFIRPSGGIYSGVGINSNNNIFFPVVAGIGPDTIQYSFTNFNGCTSTFDTVIQVLDKPTVSLAPFRSLCINESPLVLTSGMPIGGAYSGNGIVGIDTLNPQLAGLGTHTITYTYTNIAGCSNSENGQIEIFQAPKSQLDLLRTTFCLNEDSLFLVGGTGEGGHYVGSGLNSQTNYFTPSIAGLGTHRIGYVLSNFICTDTAFQEIMVLDIPKVNLGNDTIACTNSPITLDARLASHTATTTYLWSTGDTTPTITVRNIGINRINVTIFEKENTLLCLNTDEIIVTIEPAPYLDAGIDRFACLGDSIVLDVSQPTHTNTRYSWSTGQTTPRIVFKNNIDSNVIITVTDTILGCSSSDTVHISIVEPPVFSFGNDTTICFNALPFTLNANIATHPNPLQYLWNTGENTPTITVTNQVGFQNYTVRIIDLVTGCFIDADMGLQVQPLPQITLNNFIDDPNICSSELPIILEANALDDLPYRYLWNTGDTTRTIEINTVTGLNTYRVSITDTLAGCTSVDSIDINIFSLFGFDLGADTTLCQDNLPIILTPNSNLPSGENYSFQWNTGEKTSSILANNLSTFTYVLTVEGLTSGCVFKDSTTVTVLENPILDLPDTFRICTNNLDVSLDASLPSHSSNTKYVWSDGTLGPVINFNTRNSFYLYIDIQDTISNCSNRDSIFISFNDFPQRVLNQDTFICNSDILNLIAFHESHLNSDIDYLWNTGETSPNIVINTNINPFYWVKTSDKSRGCFRIDTIFIKIENQPLSNLLEDTVLCQTNLFLEANHPTHTSTTTYLWSTGETSSSIIVNTLGINIYTVQIKEQACITEFRTRVNMLPYPISNLPREIQVCQQDLPYLLTGLDQSHGINNTYRWKNLNTNSSLSDTNYILIENKGEYLLKIYNLNTNCETVDTFSIEIIPDIKPTIQVILSQNSTLPATLVFFNPISQDLPQNWFFVENNGEERLIAENTNTLIVEKYGLYILRLRNNQNCIYEDSVRIFSQNPQFNLPNAFTPNADSENDYFSPITKDLISLHISIFDYEGILLFDKTFSFQENNWNGIFLENEGWNGTTLNNIPLPTGKYIYNISYQYINSIGQKNGRRLNGEIHLLR